MHNVGARLTGAVVVGLLIGTATASASPLDPDPRFGHDGVVRLERYGGAHYSVADSRGPHTYVAASATGASSGERYLAVQKRAKRGVMLAKIGEYLEYEPSGLKVVDAVTRPHRLIIIGWVTGRVEGFEFDPYGFVAAFRRNLKPTSFGTDEFADGTRGLERLDEIAFGSVTGGAVDAAGRVLVTGRVDGRAAVTRLTPAGAIDTSYGSDGTATITTGRSSSSRDIAVHGSVALVVGNASVRGRHQGFAAQLTATGRADSGFSTDGVRLIGKPRSFLSSAAPADVGRWLIAYESGKRAGVTKIGATGELIRSFGRHGRASIRCTRHQGHRAVDALAIENHAGKLARIAMATSCRRDGQLRRLGSVWRPGGGSVPSLRPDATGRLPYSPATEDLTFNAAGRLMALTWNYLYRMD